MNPTTVKAAWLHFPSIFISPSTNIVVNDKQKGEMYLSWFLSIKLPLKEFSCLKISSSTGWTIVLIDWIQNLDTPRKILNISYIDSLRKTSCFCHVLSLHILVPSLLIFQIYSTKSCNMVFYENLVL